MSKRTHRHSGPQRTVKRAKTGAEGVSKARKPENRGHKIIASVYEDSKKQAEDLFSWLLSPISVSEYQTLFYEKKHLLVQRHDTQPDYYAGWFHTSDIKRILVSEDVRYTRDIDVTNYVNGSRVTLNPCPKAESNGTTPTYVKADSKWVWNKYNTEGASLRLLCPHEFSRQLHKMLFILEEIWGAGASSNVYLTPKGSQGFAPHYDDVEVFILQVEGAKRWRLYHPRESSEHLARSSSPNFDQSEIGEPFLDVVLRSGDMLCLPRGMIHQAVSCEEAHSLHITVSTGWHNSYADLMKLMLPNAIEKAAKDMLELRKSIPHDLFSLAPTDEKYKQFSAEVLGMVKKIAECVDVDKGVDLAARNFIHSRLPMPDKVLPKDVSKITLQSQCRLVRRDVARLIEDENGVLGLYFCIDNSIHFQEKPPQFLEIDPVFEGALKALFGAYPKFVPIQSLPIVEFSDAEEEDDVEAQEDNLQLIIALAQAGIVEVKK